MSVESAQIVAVEPQGVWVEAVQRSACQACQAKSACGQKTLSELGRPMKLWISTSQHRFQVGDQVTIELPRGGVAKSALVAYGIPLLLFVLAATLFSTWGELVSIAASMLALLAGFLIARLVSRRFAKNWTPRITTSQFD